MRETVNCTLGRLEYISSADERYQWDRSDGLCGPWRRDGTPGLGRVVLRVGTGVESGRVWGSFKCCKCCLDIKNTHRTSPKHPWKLP